MVAAASGGIPRRAGRIKQRLRAAARPVLFPLDRLSYSVYALSHRHSNAAQTLELEPHVQRVLILSPHQDDEVLGCGGFMARYAAQRSIRVAYVTDGKGRPHRSAQARKALAEQRKQEAGQVCRALCLEEPEFLDMEDGRLGDGGQLVDALARLIGRTRPQIVMSPFITDGGHADHIATTRALAEVDDALLAETQICLYQVHSHIPDAFLNRYLALVESEHEAKEQALRMYVSQDMTDSLTLSKYLLFDKVAPHVRKPPRCASVEHFSVLRCADFKALCKRPEVGELARRIKSINYSPYSFRHFLHNKRILDEL